MERAPGFLAQVPRADRDGMPGIARGHRGNGRVQPAALGRLAAFGRLVQTSPMTRPLLMIVLALALSACGFQLRDALVLPPDLGPVKVVSVDSRSPLAESLAQALTRAGAVPATSDTQEAAVLDLQAERWGDTPISVDALGRGQEFSLRYAVVFELRKADGTRLVPQQTIELSRDYIAIPTQSEGTEGEREILVRELRREMTASVLRRIDAVTRRGAGGQAGQPAPAVVAPDAARAAQDALDALDAREDPPVDEVPPEDPPPGAPAPR